MRSFAALLVLVGHCLASHVAAAAQSQDCKLCRDDYTACVKAHTQGACKTNYDICMNHLSDKVTEQNNQARTRPRYSRRRTLRRMSAFGTKRICSRCLLLVRFRSKADNTI